MTEIDLTTSAGVAAATMIIVEIVKQLFVSFELKQYPWYGAAFNLFIVIVAVFVSMLSMIVVDADVFDALFNGFIAGFGSIGVYEPFANVLRGVQSLRKKS